MDTESERIEYVARHTEIITYPRQLLASFWVTNIYYYLLTEPTYSEISNDTNETVIREGRVIAERPKIVTPYYLTHLEGFSYDARQYLEKLLMMHGPNAPGLFYAYKNEPKGLNIVSDSLPAGVGRSHGGIPVGARQIIEEMFQQAYRGEIKAHDLEQELNRWGAFEEYQDRFFT